MATITWIMIAIFVLLILFAVVAIWISKKHKRPPDYYNLFIIGVVWLPIGIVLNNAALWILGAVFMAVGLVNRKKWKQNRVRWQDLDKNERKIRIIIMILLGVMVLIGLVFWFLFSKGFF